jgi:chemotaxis protein methyltransferase CheR
MELSDASNQILTRLLEARTGQQLSIGRHWRIASMLGGLMRKRGIASLDELIAMLAQPHGKALADQVVDALLNNETYFFRDKLPFDLIGQQLLPELARRNAATRRITMWSAGCSTGQEALSLAMLLAQQPAQWENWTFEILATDVSASVIQTARQGCFSQFEIQRGLGAMQMIEWFDETPNGWQAKSALLDRIGFQVHNVLEPLPVAKQFDIVLCRNVLLYFGDAMRRKAFDRLANALAPDGWLLLGAGETVVGQTDRLQPDAGCIGVYRHADEPAAKPVPSRSERSADLAREAGRQAARQARSRSA